MPNIVGFNSSKTLVEHEESFINITCADGYYLSDVSGVCRPLCTLWTEPKNVDADYIAVIVVVVVGLLSAITLVIMGLTVQRKTMYDLRNITILAILVGSVSYINIQILLLLLVYTQVEVSDILSGVPLHNSNCYG